MNQVASAMNRVIDSPLSFALAYLLIGGLATSITRLPIFTLIGLIGATWYWFVFILRGEDNGAPAALSGPEKRAAKARMLFVDDTLRALAMSAGVKRPFKSHFARHGAYIFYTPFWTRVRVSRAICARVSDSSLRLVLAHEIGHADFRSKRFFYPREATIAEEIYADQVAVSLTGSTPRDWACAMKEMADAEGWRWEESAFSLRRAALGISDSEWRFAGAK